MLFQAVDAAQNRLSMSLARAHQNIDEATQVLYRFIDEHRRLALKDLENAYGAKQLQLTVVDKKVALLAITLKIVEQDSEIVQYYA